MNYFSRVFLILFVFVLFGAGCAAQNDVIPQIDQNNEGLTQQLNSEAMMELPGPTVLPEAEIGNKIARINTEKGEIVIVLYADTAPLTTSNFVGLAQRGFYNGLTFHRREEGFVIQGGDPNGNGTGGPGYTFADELKDNHTYKRGVVAMANRGPNTNGSQFFIMLSDYPLPKQYTIFGEVLSGMEAVDAITVGDKMTTVTIESQDKDFK